MKPFLYFFLLSSTLVVFGSVKNILLIVSDDLKADAINCYGNKTALTPNIDSLAAEGTLFQNAYCQGTVCAPSRASFMRVDILEKTRSLGVNIFKNMDIQVHGWAKSSICGFPVILLPVPMVRM